MVFIVMSSPLTSGSAFTWSFPHILLISASVNEVNPLAFIASSVFGPNFPSGANPKQAWTVLIGSATQFKEYVPLHDLYLDDDTLKSLNEVE